MDNPYRKGRLRFFLSIKLPIIDSLSVTSISTVIYIAVTEGRLRSPKSRTQRTSTPLAALPALTPPSSPWTTSGSAPVAPKIHWNYR